jgi:putative phosphoesterase
MKRIGLLSDTHGTVPETMASFFSGCDEIWHAGDIGNQQVIDHLSSIKPIRAVYGNIDDANIRMQYPEYQVFVVEDLKVLLVHIGGYPGKYNKKILPILQKEKPTLMVSGHSHILKVMYDKKYGLLYINPGAAGNNGWHKVITYIRFTIDGEEIKDLEIGEIPRKSIKNE